MSGYYNSSDLISISFPNIEMTVDVLEIKEVAFTLITVRKPAFA